MSEAGQTKTASHLLFSFLIPRISRLAALPLTPRIAIPLSFKSPPLPSPPLPITRALRTLHSPIFLSLSSPQLNENWETASSLFTNYYIVIYCILFIFSFYLTLLVSLNSLQKLNIK